MCLIDSLILAINKFWYGMNQKIDDYDCLILLKNTNPTVRSKNYNSILITANMDPDTKAIHNYNKKIHNDSRVEHLLLPVRDGLMIARKK